MSHKSCPSCSASPICYAYISTQKILEDCAFINDLTLPEEYPEDVTGNLSDVFVAIAHACENFIPEDEDEPPIDDISN